MAKHINPFTDTGFKIIFGKEKNKDVLIDFLNDLLEGSLFHDPIVDAEYMNNEKTGESPEDRTTVNDIHCKTKCGRHFIVEMQNYGHANFFDRLVCYSAMAVVEQMKKGAWDYKIDAVYTVCFANFHVNPLPRKLKVDCGISDFDTGQPLTDLLRFIVIQLPEFKIDNPDDCVTNFEKWIYSLKNMEHMTHIPFAARDNSFARLSRAGEEAAMTPEERRNYINDQKQFLTIINIERTRFNEGMAKGEAKGIEEGQAMIIISMHESGMAPEQISSITKLPVSKIQYLLNLRK